MTQAVSIAPDDSVIYRSIERRQVYQLFQVLVGAHLSISKGAMVGKKVRLKSARMKITVHLMIGTMLFHATEYAWRSPVILRLSFCSAHWPMAIRCWTLSRGVGCTGSRQDHGQRSCTEHESWAYVTNQQPSLPLD